MGSMSIGNCSPKFTWIPLIPNSIMLCNVWVIEDCGKYKYSMRYSMDGSCLSLMRISQLNYNIFSVVLFPLFVEESELTKTFVRLYVCTKSKCKQPEHTEYLGNYAYFMEMGLELTQQNIIHSDEWIETFHQLNFWPITRST